MTPTQTLKNSLRKTLISIGFRALPVRSIPSVLVGRNRTPGLGIYSRQSRKEILGLTSKLSKNNKKEKPVARKKSNGSAPLIIRSVRPLTDNQAAAFDAYKTRNLLLHGWAGTGKTFLALYLALKEVLETEKYSKIYIIRSAVPTRAMGFLPGSIEEKMEIYETPYSEIVNSLLSRFDGYEVLKQKNMVEFVSTSYLRGVTMENSVIFVDEIQNMQFHELDTIITRAGKNIKMILAGDYHQTDLLNGSKGDCLKFMDIIHSLEEFESVHFDIDDIVRNDLVKSYLIAKENRPLAQRL
jgi:phosphate starvation-inducible protein PhoH